MATQEQKARVVADLTETLRLMASDCDFQIGDTDTEWWLEFRDGRMFAHQASGETPDFELRIVPVQET